MSTAVELSMPSLPTGQHINEPSASEIAIEDHSPEGDAQDPESNLSEQPPAKVPDVDARLTSAQALRELEPEPEEIPLEERRRVFTELALPELEYAYPAPGQDASVTLNVAIALPESKSLHRFRMAAAFVTLFLAGWNGGSTGALLPYIERAYGINYARVSILFVCTFLGYVLAAACTGALSRRIGFGRALCLAVIVELIGNVINSSQASHFGVMGFGFFVVGTAFATQLGLCNAYFALLPKPLLWTGLLHGIYGLGAFASPLVATVMVTKGLPYNLFYTTNIGMNVPVLAITWFAFGNLKELPSSHAGEAAGHASLKDSLKSRTVWTLAIFLMLYVGAEETIGGWIVSYILQVRKGTPEGASWVASAFYLGVAIGRIALPSLNMTLGERLAILLYLALAIVLTTLAWLLPALSSTASCTALTGLLISTFYTAAITTGGKLLPRSMHADAFALMSSVGQVGSAVFPLLVGVMSTKKGIWVVEPTVVALLGAQGVCWALVPKVGRRLD